MKAAYLKGSRNIELSEVPTPAPGPGEVRIRVIAAGICGTDVRLYQSPLPTLPLPLILGHDFAGVVDAVGPGVRIVREGDRVTADPMRSCGSCPYCQRGDNNHCPSYSYMGMQVPGCFQEYVVCEERYIFPLPEHLSFERASVAEPGASALHNIPRLGIKAGDPVVVIGAGPIGMAHMQVAKLQTGCTTIVVDLLADRLQTAKAAGTDYTIDASQEDAHRRVGELCGSARNFVLNCAGSAAADKLCIELANPRSTVLLVGSGRTDIPVASIIAKELWVTGGKGGGSLYAEALAMLADGRLTVDPLITHRLGFDQVKEALDLLVDHPAEANKVILNI